MKPRFEKDSESQPSKCPQCNSPLIGDRAAGEVVCPTCGYVLLDEVEFEGPEWKAVDPEDKLKKSRVGAPLTYTLHDFGLTTAIDGSGVDSHGNRITGDERAKMGRMKTWQFRLRTIDSKERSMSNVLSKIHEISVGLNLPRNVSETAAYIFRQYSKPNFCRRCKEEVEPAEVPVCLDCGIGIVRKCPQCGVRGSSDERYCRHCGTSVKSSCVKCGREYPSEPFCPRCGTPLHSRSRGKQVAGVASAATYLACRKCEVNRSLGEVAERSYLNKKVVAKYYRQMVKDMEMSSVPMASIQKHISKLFNNLNATTKMPEKVERLAISISTKASGASMSSGRSPAGLAAAFLYVSANLLNEHLPQRDVAEAAGITEVTIRKRCKELFENFNISVRVHAA